ncbi:hypothetical protein HNR34_002715 [Geobacillus subterraneus]
MKKDVQQLDILFLLTVRFGYEIFSSCKSKKRDLICGGGFIIQPRSISEMILNCGGMARVLFFSFGGVFSKSHLLPIVLKTTRPLCIMKKCGKSEEMTCNLAYIRV